MAWLVKTKAQKYSNALVLLLGFIREIDAMTAMKSHT